MGVGGVVPPFLTFALDGGEWSASLPCCFTPGERAPSTHWIGGWVGPRAGLDAVEKRKIMHDTEVMLHIFFDHKGVVHYKLTSFRLVHGVLQNWT
jgi:hypothetical protein